MQRRAERRQPPDGDNIGSLTRLRSPLRVSWFRSNPPVGPCATSDISPSQSLDPFRSPFMGRVGYAKPPPTLQNNHDPAPVHRQMASRRALRTQRLPAALPRLVRTARPPEAG